MLALPYRGGPALEIYHRGDVGRRDQELEELPGLVRVLRLGRDGVAAAGDDVELALRSGRRVDHVEVEGLLLLLVEEDLRVVADGHRHQAVAPGVALAHAV